MCHNPLVCIGDGDNIGVYLLSGDLQGASKFSLQVKIAIEDIASLAKSELNALLIYVAGDDICFIIDAEINIYDILNNYSKSFFTKTGKTMSFGVGQTSVEALISLRKAKVSGKGCVIISGDNQE